MSTIPDSRTTPKHRTPRTRSPRRDRASFDYGYRYVGERLPDGGERRMRVPLTLDDVLHPQEGDVHVLSDPHSIDCTYLRVVAEARSQGDASVVVLSDCGIFWDIPGLRHHSPDFALIFGVQQRKDWRTFHVATEKVRPSLIIEVTSPKTRVTDLDDKVVEYAIAGVPYYVIADAREGSDRKPARRRLELVAYRLKGKTYQRVRADKQGRVRLDPLNLLLGVRVDPRTGGDRLVLIDPATNQEIGDYAALDQARASRGPGPGRRGPGSGRRRACGRRGPGSGRRRGPHPRAGSRTERAQTTKISDRAAEASHIRFSNAASDRRAAGR